MEQPQLLLGHGASGTAASMAPWVDALALVGITARALDLPRGNAERAADVFTAAAVQHPGALLGGHSFGGRVASLVAGRRAVPGLVLLSYPLHRPGHPDDLRTGHWTDIDAPVLLLSGESDPFARIDLLRQEVSRLRHAELITYPRTGHGVLTHIADAAPRIAAFVRTITATVAR